MGRPPPSEAGASGTGPSAEALAAAAAFGAPASSGAADGSRLQRPPGAPPLLRQYTGRAVAAANPTVANTLKVLKEAQAEATKNVISRFDMPTSSSATHAAASRAAHTRRMSSLSAARTEAATGRVAPSPAGRVPPPSTMVTPPVSKVSGPITAGLAAYTRLHGTAGLAARRLQSGAQAKSAAAAQPTAAVRLRASASLSALGRKHVSSQQAGVAGGAAGAASEGALHEPGLEQPAVQTPAQGGISSLNPYFRPRRRSMKEGSWDPTSPAVFDRRDQRSRA